MSGDIREGEVTLPFDPAETATGPRVAFIGRIHSPWTQGKAPRNIGPARETREPARIQLDPDYARGMSGLHVGQDIIVIYWMDRSRRDLLVQNPRHVQGTRGTFALRSPARPNPIAQSTVRITAIDIDTGEIGIDAIDCYDGTPVIDIKPWHDRIDMPADWKPT